MIVGMGIDITDLGRIRRAMERFGSKLTLRIFSRLERACLPAHLSASFVAGRFAAKEAAAKALGTGFSGGVGPDQISVMDNPDGKPELQFAGAAARIAEHLNVSSALVSISHERTNAVALVILERADHA